MEEWYLRIAGTEYGPYNREQLVQYIGEGRVSGSHGLRQAPSPDWMEARQVPALAAYFAPAGGADSAAVKNEPPPLPAAGKPRKKGLLRRPLFWIIFILVLVYLGFVIATNLPYIYL